MDRYSVKILDLADHIYKDLAKTKVGQGKLLQDTDTDCPYAKHISHAGKAP